jgi:hypothetical protein
MSKKRLLNAKSSATSNQRAAIRYGAVVDRSYAPAAPEDRKKEAISASLKSLPKEPWFVIDARKRKVLKNSIFVGDPNATTIVRPPGLVTRAISRNIPKTPLWRLGERFKDLT